MFPFKSSGEIVLNRHQLLHHDSSNETELNCLEIIFLENFQTI